MVVVLLVMDLVCFNIIQVMHMLLIAIINSKSLVASVSHWRPCLVGSRGYGTHLDLMYIYISSFIFLLHFSFIVYLFGWIGIAWLRNTLRVDVGNKYILCIYISFRLQFSYIFLFYYIYLVGSHG